MNNPKHFILISGNPVDGFTHIGPFTYEEAETHAERYLKNETWWIVALDAPSEEA